MDNKSSVDQKPSNDPKVINNYRPPIQPVIGSTYDGSGSLLSEGKAAINFDINQKSTPQATTTTTESSPESYPRQQSLYQPSASIEQHHIPPLPNETNPSFAQIEPNVQQQQNVSVPYIKPLLSPEVPSVTSISSSGDNVNSPQKNEAPKQPANQPQKAVVTKVKLSDELNLFDWFRATDIINQIAETARNSVDSVITTLDPGMKEYLYSGGNINILVMSDKDELVSSIRDSFQTVFGRATVTSDRYSAPTTATTVRQEYPIKLASGLNQALTVGRDKIKRLRSDTSTVPQNQVILAIQPALVQLLEDERPTTQSDKTQDIKDGTDGFEVHNWFLTYCMIIEDPVLGTTLKSYSQFIPVDTNIVAQAKATKFVDDKVDKTLGFPISIEELLRVPRQNSVTDSLDNNNNDEWLRVWSGLEECEIARELSLILAHTYRRKWNDCVAHT